MYKYEETTHSYFASLGYRLVLPIECLGVRLGSVMLDCSVAVLVRLKGGCGGEAPTNKGGLGAKPSLENVCLDCIFCLVDQKRLG